VQRCIEEVQGIADSGMVDRITVVCIDTDVRSVETFERGDRIEMGVKGRGGTKYQPAWQWLSEQDEMPDFVVYMTDLEPWDGFGDEPNVPLLWAASTYSASARKSLHQRMDAVPFGRCIEVV
jgi:predicted metal-dependent peptidase